MRHLLWKSEIDLDDYKEELEEEGITDQNDAYDYCNTVNQDELTFAQYDLMKPMRILCIASLGTWCGRRSGYQHLKNFNEVFNTHVNGMSELEVYVEDGMVQADEAHHDGTNHYTFYEVREGRYDTKGYNRLLDDLLSNGDVSSRRMSYYLKPLGWWPKYVYGWED